MPSDEEKDLQNVDAVLAEAGAGLPIAQPPAKAAPNTSAAIRIAAVSTVDDVHPSGYGGQPAFELSDPWRRFAGAEVRARRGMSMKWWA